MLLKISFRNIFRNKKRNFLTMSFITFGITLAIFYHGIIKGFTFQTLEIARKTDMGNYKVYSQGFYKDRDENEKLDFLFDEKDFFGKYKLNKAVPRLNFDGTITSGEWSLPVVFYGVDREKENSFFEREKDIIYGDFLLKPEGVVIGSGIAKDLNLKLHDEITILTRTSQKSINAYDLEITGIINTKNSLLNKNTVFLNMSFAKEFILSQNVNEIIIFDKNPPVVDGYDLISLEKELDEMISLMEVKGKSATNMVFLILLMGAVGIANAMLMAMLEREKEIGIFLAMGMETREIKLMFLLESFFLGVLGSGMGLILGTFIVLLTAKYGIPLPASFYDGMDLNMILPDRMYAVISVKTYIAYFVLGVVVSSLAGIYSSLKSSKIEPLEVLRD